MQQPPTRLPWCPNWLFGVWINNTVLEGNPNIDTIIRFEEKHRKAKEFLNLALEIRANKYDLLMRLFKVRKLVSRIIEWSQRSISYKKKDALFYILTMYRLRNCQNKSWSSDWKKVITGPPSLTGKMDPLPKLFNSSKKINMLWRFWKIPTSKSKNSDD
jgi:heptosyltransferase-2